jgi:hypothetical protein
VRRTARLNRLDRLDRGAARRRARAHAVRLGRDLAELRQAEASADGDLAIRLRHRVQVTVRNLGAALSRGLDADYGPDADLGLLRGHARNLELVIRRCLEAALRPGAEPLLRSGWFEPTVRFADDLAATLDRFDARAQRVEDELLDDAWSATPTGRLLALAAFVLPAGQRRGFVEEQCANLGLAESRREWAGYVASLLVRMPSIAAAALAAGAAQRGGLP